MGHRAEVMPAMEMLLSAIRRWQKTAVLGDNRAVSMVEIAGLRGSGLAILLKPRKSSRLTRCVMDIDRARNGGTLLHGQAASYSPVSRKFIGGEQ